MRVIVVAATPTMRAGLRTMLETAEESGVLVVGEASSTAEGFPGDPEADVLLVADDGALQTAALADDGAQSLVLLSEDEGAVARLRGLPLRGWGILPPDASPEELAAAVLAAAQGLTVLSRQLVERLPHEPATVEELPEPLTAREREVLELLGHGLSNRLIARDLHISEHTVKFHISSLYSKLGVGNRAEAVSQGARRGLISL
ncbi:MAG TPA: response regulator transcription factor [Rubrobacteraceae bacterium]|nr:response regulator transcription factor [Rubrobacteraceae bacterium]